MTFLACNLRHVNCMPQKGANSAGIQSLLDALNAASREAEALFASAPAPALEQAPRSGAWSAAQCLAHLAATNFLYIAAMRAAIAPAIHLRNHERNGHLRPGIFTRWFLAQMEPPVKLRVSAPRAVLPPNVTARAARKEFLASQTTVIELLTECRYLDLNRIRFHSPFLPLLRFTVGAPASSSASEAGARSKP